MSISTAKKPRIVILGGGFAGLQTAKKLGKLPPEKCEVILIDRRNHHLFQPLLYQVATAGLSPADIASPIRAILHDSSCEVWMDEVRGIDPAKQEVHLATKSVHYDYLVVATGATHSYFGRGEWEPFAPGLKTVEDATAIRTKILSAFENAEMLARKEQEAWLHFVVVGGGPTGVEMAGAIAELSHRVLARDFKHIDPETIKIDLIEAGPKVLAAYADELSAKAKAELQRLGVSVRLNSRVEKIDDQGVWIGGQLIPSKNIVWAAGVLASPAGKWLGVEMDNSGRVKVESNLTLKQYPNIFVVGDTATVADEKGKPLPGIAPVALQQGKYVAAVLLSKIDDKELPGPFRYLDKGNLATVGRRFAVGSVKNIPFWGVFAWLVWTVVHIFYLIGFRNRVSVFLQWCWAYLTYQKGARLITHPGRKN